VRSSARMNSSTERSSGHALMHERPELLATLLADWLDRSRASETC
jgi:hypothetical protein